ncbi:MAG: hypothetical protein ACI91O_000200 [Candidatus Poriferisodalaceae bacterium]
MPHPKANRCRSGPGSVDVKDGDRVEAGFAVVWHRGEEVYPTVLVVVCEARGRSVGELISEEVFSWGEAVEGLDLGKRGLVTFLVHPLIHSVVEVEAGRPVEHGAAERSAVVEHAFAESIESRRVLLECG